MSDAGSPTGIPLAMARQLAEKKTHTSTIVQEPGFFLGLSLFYLLFALSPQVPQVPLPDQINKLGAARRVGPLSKSPSFLFPMLFNSLHTRLSTETQSDSFLSHT